MIEFDVLRTRDGRLVLAHDYADAERRECLTLEEGLDHFAGEAYAGVELDVDLKLPGLRARGRRGARPARAPRALARLDDVPGEPRPARRARARSPARLVGAARAAQLSEVAAHVRLPAYAMAAYMRARLPALAAARIRAGGCEAIMSHQILVSRRLVRGGARRGRPALRLDRGRRVEDPRARGARRGRRDHERPAAVRLAADRAGAGRLRGGLARAELHLGDGAQLVGLPVGGTFSAKVQPACCQVNSAEPASCHGEVDCPASGTQPSGLSHWAVKRTCIGRSSRRRRAGRARRARPSCRCSRLAHVDVELVRSGAPAGRQRDRQRRRERRRAPGHSRPSRAIEGSLAAASGGRHAAATR